MFVFIINNYVSIYCDMYILEKYKVILFIQSEKWEKVWRFVGKRVCKNRYCRVQENIYYSEG